MDLAVLSAPDIEGRSTLVDAILSPPWSGVLDVELVGGIRETSCGVFICRRQGVKRDFAVRRNLGLTEGGTCPFFEFVNIRLNIPFALLRIVWYCMSGDETKGNARITEASYLEAIVFIALHRPNCSRLIFLVRCRRYPEYVSGL